MMKKTYRNGEYTMGLSPNENQWLVLNGNKCVATLDVEWVLRRYGTLHVDPLLLLKDFLWWYYSL